MANAAVAVPAAIGSHGPPTRTLSVPGSAIGLLAQSHYVDWHDAD